MWKQFGLQTSIFELSLACYGQPEKKNEKNGDVKHTGKVKQICKGKTFMLVGEQCKTTCDNNFASTRGLAEKCSTHDH